MLRRPTSRCQGDSVRSSVRPVIIGELLLFYGRGHTLASVFHVPRFAPDEEEAEERGTTPGREKYERRGDPRGSLGREREREGRKRN